MYTVPGAGVRAISGGTMFLSVPGAFSPPYRMASRRWNEEDVIVVEKIGKFKDKLDISVFTSSGFIPLPEHGQLSVADLPVLVSAGR